MAIDWSTMAAGNTVYNTYGTNTTPYDEQYAQTKRNTNPMAGGILPFDQFAFRGIKPVNPEVAKEEALYTGRTFDQVKNEAEAEYLARAAQRRDLDRQSIVMGGTDRYQQARLAMEQQRALSDTRGLTAGAAEGARQGLSATQQVALNQIESQTQSELLQLKQQGIQDEFLAQEWADRKLQEFQTSSPEAGQLRALQGLYQDAANRSDVAKMEELAPQIAATELAMFGTSQTEIKELINLAETGNIPELSARFKRQVNRVTSDSGMSNLLIGLGLTAGGTAAAVGAGSTIAGAITAAGGVGAALTSTGIGATIGVPLLALAGLTAVGFGIYNLVVAGNKEWRSVEKRNELLDGFLADEKARLRSLGYTDEQINSAIEAKLDELDPVYQR